MINVYVFDFRMNNDSDCNRLPPFNIQLYDLFDLADGLMLL